jgi:hypothetical protein
MVLFYSINLKLSIMDKLAWITDVLFQLLVEHHPLVVLAAHRGSGIVDVTPITNVPQRHASAGHAGTGRLTALPHVPGVADVDPREADSLPSLRVASHNPGCAGRSRTRARSGVLLDFGPGPMKGRPVRGQLSRRQEAQRIAPPVRICL